MECPTQKTAILLLVCISFFIACKNDSKKPEREDKNNQAKKEYSLQLIENKDSTFGFSIASGEKKIIDQKNIPAAAGNKGFKTKNEATACGNLMLQKIKNNIWPPSVAIRELDSLGIKY